MTAPKRLPGLTVFLPSHNEEGNVARVVAGFLAELPKVAERYEVVVVDDGSRDRTGEIADRLAAAENSHVLAIHHAKNLGYGGGRRPRLFTRAPPISFFFRRGGGVASRGH